MPAANVKLVPEPLVQVTPLSLLYCQVAPASRLPTVTKPFFVMPSVLLAPVSVMLNVPMVGAVVSTVTAVVILAMVAPDCTLPALSVSRIWIALAA